MYESHCSMPVKYELLVFELYSFSHHLFTRCSFFIFFFTFFISGLFPFECQTNEKNMFLFGNKILVI